MDANGLLTSSDQPQHRCNLDSLWHTADIPVSPHHTADKDEVKETITEHQIRYSATFNGLSERRADGTLILSSRQGQQAVVIWRRALVVEAPALLLSDMFVLAYAKRLLQTRSVDFGRQQK